jgi:hypothetical protein
MPPILSRVLLKVESGRARYAGNDLDRDVTDEAAVKGPVPAEVRRTHNGRPTCTTDDLTAGIGRPKVVYQ